MNSGTACPLCKKEFGIFRHRYECAACKGTFCDDCTPNKFVIPPNPDAARVCTTCEQSVRRTAKDADGGRRLGGGEGPSKNASDASEREMRARLAEERLNAQRLPSSTKKTSVAKLHPPARKEPEECQQTPPAQSQGRTLGTSGPATAASPPTGESNPVLAAALRRQQQQQGTMRPAPSMDPERQQILLEIQTLLRSKNEEEPFGLRSMDAVKMRLYLKHLREK